MFICRVLFIFTQTTNFLKLFRIHKIKKFLLLNSVLCAKPNISDFCIQLVDKEWNMFVKYNA